MNYIYNLTTIGFEGSVERGVLGGVKGGVDGIKGGAEGGAQVWQVAGRSLALNLDNKVSSIMRVSRIRYNLSYLRT